MERTSVIEGLGRVLVVAPHGADRPSTALLAEMLAGDLGAFAVINRGWKRSAKVDQLNDMADCNSMKHLQEDVVREEFLNPVLRCVSRIKKNHEKALVVVLHGCEDRPQPGDKNEFLDIVLGYGAGSPPSHSCSMNTKNSMLHFLQQEGFGVWEGAPGGRYAGRAKNCINQLFVRWKPDNDVESLQIAIVEDLISDEGMVAMTSEGLVSAIDTLLLSEEEEMERPEVGRI